MLLFATLTACAEPGSRDPSLSGRWSGTSDAHQEFVMALVDQAGEVTGGGMVSVSPADFGVTGTLDHDTVELTFDFGTERQVYRAERIGLDHMIGDVQEGHVTVRLALDRIALPDED
jgi:hypothetical protein